MWINIFLVALIIFLLLMLSMVWPPDSPWAPWWTTKKEKIKKALLLAKVTKKDVVFDLGCGDARVLLVAAKEFGTRGIGIEIDPLRFLFSKILVKLNNQSAKVKIIKGNFFDQDLKSATTVFLYLVPKALGRLKPKLLKELKPGTKIISIKYDFPENAGLVKIAQDKKSKILIYKIK